MTTDEKINQIARESEVIKKSLIDKSVIDQFILNNKGKKVVAVQGLGFVGSVMSLVCANAVNGDYAVIGVDLPIRSSIDKIAAINSGSFPVKSDDPLIDQYYRKALHNGNLLATSSEYAYQFADIVVVDVNLDVTKELDANRKITGFDVEIRGFEEAIRSLGRNCCPNVLILIETTVPPGTCIKVVKPIIEEEFKNRGLTVDQYLLGHSYERVMPGPKYIESIQSFPRVYSGINCQSADAIEEFLKTIIDVARCQLTRLETTNATEIAKVLENSYRALNIAFMIEWTRFAEEAKVNLYEIVKAIRVRDTHRNLMLPGIGVGGYCLTKDPLLASWSRKNNFGGGSDLMMSVGAVSQNNQMPIHAFDRLRRDYGSLSGKVIGICGVSYRGDVGDTRFSPVQPFVEAIEVAGGQCYCHDPYVSDWCELNRKIYNKLSDILSFDIDIIVICAGHKVYSDPQFCAQINASNRPLFLFDTIGYLDQEQIESLSRFHRVKVLGRGDI